LGAGGREFKSRRPDFEKSFVAEIILTNPPLSAALPIRFDLLITFSGVFSESILKMAQENCLTAIRSIYLLNSISVLSFATWFLGEFFVKCDT
jgi:hypothetical protein